VFLLSQSTFKVDVSTIEHDGGVTAMVALFITKTQTGGLAQWRLDFQMSKLGFLLLAYWRCLLSYVQSIASG